MGSSTDQHLLRSTICIAQLKKAIINICACRTSLVLLFPQRAILARFGCYAIHGYIFRITSEALIDHSSCLQNTKFCKQQHNNAYASRGLLQTQTPIKLNNTTRVIVIFKDIGNRVSNFFWLTHALQRNKGRHFGQRFRLHP